MSFKLVFFSNQHPEGYGCKPHFIPTELYADAVKELCERFEIETSLEEDVTEGLVDLPGMIMADRTYQEFDLDGFKLSIPTTDMLFYFKELKDGKPRSLSGKRYYKLHGWIHCVIITQEMRNMMLAQIESNLPEIDAKMHAENAEFDRAIAKINDENANILISPRSVPIKPDKDLN